MSVIEVDQLAQGRVWIASDALSNGLIDEIGELEDAIAYAANLVDVTDYSVVDYPYYKSPFELFLEDISSMSISISNFSKLKTLSDDPSELLKELFSVPVEQRIYTKMPYTIYLD